MTGGTQLREGADFASSQGISDRVTFTQSNDSSTFEQSKKPTRPNRSTRIGKCRVGLFLLVTTQRPGRVFDTHDATRRDQTMIAPRTTTLRRRVMLLEAAAVGLAALTVAAGSVVAWAIDSLPPF